MRGTKAELKQKQLTFEKQGRCRVTWWRWLSGLVNCDIMMMMMTVSKVVVHDKRSFFAIVETCDSPSPLLNHKKTLWSIFLSEMQSPFCPLRARCYTNKSHFASAASLEKVILGSKISKWGVFSVEEMQTSWNLSFFIYLNILSAFTTQIQNKSSYFVKTKTSLPRIR